MHLPLSLFRALALGGVLSGFVSAPALAHEFWIEPESEKVDVGETVRAELLVGGMLSGEAYP